MIVAFWKNYFDRIKNKQIDTWDIQWAYACIIHGAFAAVPINNLISNIGYAGAHANGIKSYLHEMPIAPLKKLIQHPNGDVRPDKVLDKKTYNLCSCSKACKGQYLKRSLFG